MTRTTEGSSPPSTNPVVEFTPSTKLGTTLSLNFCTKSPALQGQAISHAVATTFSTTQKEGVGGGGRGKKQQYSILENSMYEWAILPEQFRGN